MLKQELRIAQAAEDELERLYKIERSEVKKMDSLLTEEQILLSNISRVERLHDAALERLAEFSLADEALKKGRATVNVRIVEAPTHTEMLVWPVKIPILAACLILGLVTGVLIASTRPPQPEPHSAE
ncbi:MAG: hypothetical protein IID45_02440 [Planctomycetes bacterium]|nr:hypothetical protein [Planctomycetota bacterium]